MGLCHVSLKSLETQWNTFITGELTLPWLHLDCTKFGPQLPKLMVIVPNAVVPLIYNGMISIWGIPQDQRIPETRYVYNECCYDVW